MLGTLNQIQFDGIPQKLATSVAILLIALILRVLASAAIRAATRKIEDDDPTTSTALEQRAYTLGNVMKSALNLIIYGITFITIMSEWGINVAPILTGAGIMGLAVGFGAQSLVKDAINGFFILLENQFNVGDYVKISGFEGKVVTMSLRNTVLKTDRGVTHNIPNSKIDVVTKYTKKVPS